MWQQKKNDIRDIFLSALIVSLIWWLFFGWYGQRLLAGNDATLEMLYYSELLRVGGDWRQILVNPLLFGGVDFHGLFGSLIIYQILAKLGVGAAAAYNFTTIFLQTGLCFFALRSAQNLSPYCGASREWTLFEKFTLIALVAFLPHIGWHIGYGHQNFLSGMLAFSSVFCLCTSLLRGSVSPILWTVCALFLANAMSSLGQQLVFATFSLAVPILFSVLWLEKGKLKKTDLLWWVCFYHVCCYAFLDILKCTPLQWVVI